MNLAKVVKKGIRTMSLIQNEYGDLLPIATKDSVQYLSGFSLNSGLKAFVCCLVCFLDNISKYERTLGIKYYLLGRCLV